MKYIQTDKAPAAVGPYSQGTAKHGEMVFVSGQIPLVPETGEMVQGDIVEQAPQVFKNLLNVVWASGCSVNDIAKVTIFVTDMSRFKDINEVYSQFFTDHKPARAVVEVSALPLGALIEADCFCVR